MRVSGVSSPYCRMRSSLRTFIERHFRKCPSVNVILATMVGWAKPGNDGESGARLQASRPQSTTTRVPLATR